MSQVTLRLEKVTPANPPHHPQFTAYVEFRLESGNAIMRFWNVHKNGRPVSQKERENFQSGEAARNYVKNMRAMYEKQGFAAVSGEWLAQSASSKSKGKKSETPDGEKSEKVKAPFVSKTDLGALPAGSIPPADLETTNPS